MPKIIVTIQARMGSVRLPKKVMLPILEKPILWHIYNRLKYCDNVDLICIATSTNPLDDEIEDFALKEHIPIFRGPEKILIERLLNAAKKFGADAIVRITGDCPLVDPKIVDQLIHLYKIKPEVEFVSNTLQRTFPDGLDAEVISTKLLEKLEAELTDEDEREYFVNHVIKNHSKYQCANYSQSKNLSHLRWTSDYKEDYEFVKKIYERLYEKSRIFYMQNILELLEKNPDLITINQKHFNSSTTNS